MRREAKKERGIKKDRDRAAPSRERSLRSLILSHARARFAPSKFFLSKFSLLPKSRRRLRMKNIEMYRISVNCTIISRNNDDYSLPYIKIASGKTSRRNKETKEYLKIK